MRGEEVDVLLRGRGFLREALVAPALLEERLLEIVGLRLVQRDGDGVLGDARVRCSPPLLPPFQGSTHGAA